MKYISLVKAIALLCSFFVITSCVSSNGTSGDLSQTRVADASDLSWVNPKDNSLYIRGIEQPMLEVSNDFRYGGAEIVPSPSQQIKRHLFPGPASSFVAITVLQGSPADVRQAVQDKSAKDWEFVVQQIEGPEWIKVVGSTTPCCTNLIHSRYLFVPFKQAGHTALRELGGSEQNAQAVAAKDDEQGYILVVSYAAPLPENLPAASWQDKGLFNGNASGAIAGQNGNVISSHNTGLSFDNDQMPGLYNPQLGSEQRHFLQKHANKAQQAYELK